MTLYIILVVLAILVGVVAAAQSLRHQAIVRSTGTDGWIYFVSTIDGAFDDPPSPIKIGYTRRNPAVDRLPEIATMSPEPLHVIYSFYSKQPAAMEEAIHKELAAYRRHGEWFDRDATLAWLDNYREIHA